MTILFTISAIILLLAIGFYKFIKSDEYRMHKAIANKYNNRPKAGK